MSGPFNTNTASATVLLSAALSLAPSPQTPGFVAAPGIVEQVQAQKVSLTSVEDLCAYCWTALEPLDELQFSEINKQKIFVRALRRFAQPDFLDQDPYAALRRECAALAELAVMMFRHEPDPNEKLTALLKLDQEEYDTLLRIIINAPTILDGTGKLDHRVNEVLADGADSAIRTAQRAKRKLRRSLSRY